MVAFLLAVLALAVLFALFGWLSTLGGAEGCPGCKHSGSPDCGATCPLLKESLERSGAVRH